jgi:ribosomal-protein-alanine N-acetyltransferase
MEQDAQALLEIKYDEQVMKYHPTFLQRDATLDFAKIVIAFFQSVKAKGLIIDDLHPERGCLYAICLKASGEVIGVITVHPLEYLYEVQMGWFMKGQLTGQGYASEAGAAVSDYLLDALSLDYISVCMDVDNPASFRTAQKSGFRLFERRVPYDYHYSACNVEDFNEVGKHFAKKQSETGSCYYYFRKFNKHSKTAARFYGDTKYEGRFSE